MRNPLALSGRLIVAAVGKPMGRNYWHNDQRLYDVDGSVLYSAIQKKTYRDVGRSAAGFVLSVPFAVAAVVSPMIDPLRVEEAITCLICIGINLICFSNFRSDIRNSQIIHVAGCPARDDPGVRAGITDDVFGEEEGEEDEEAEYEEEQDEEPADEDAPDNVVAFGAQKSDDSELSEPPQSGEAW